MQQAGDLSALLDPASIAVIGASDDPHKVGGRPIEYLRRYGFAGRVYPVNPRRETAQGLPCFASIGDVPERVDLAVVVVPGTAVVDVLEACAAAGVRSCAVFSSGFAELGDEGRRIQAEITALARRSGMRVLGPNCQGVANLGTRSIASFSTSFAEGALAEGASAIVSQSGAVAAMVYNLQRGWGGGVRYWVASGNEADVTVPELVGRIVEDPGVKVVQAYLEDIKDAETLASSAARANALGKPVLVLKSGRTAEGQRAASSHTGAIAGEDVVLDAVLRHHRLVRVRDVIELSHFPVVFGQDKRPRGRKVAVITNSGGLGVMLVDQCKEVGLELARLSEETIRRLEDALPAFASSTNPIDITVELLNDRHLLAKVLPVLADDPEVDIVLYGLGIMAKGYDIPTIVDDVVDAHHGGPQLHVVAWVGGAPGVAERFNERGVPAFEHPTMCVDAVAAYADHCLTALDGPPPDRPAPGTGAGLDAYRRHTVAGFLSEHRSKELLRPWGLPFPAEALATTADEAAAAAAEIGYPVAVKLSSPAVQHKSDAGMLALDVADERDLRRLAEDMLTRGRELAGPEAVEGVLVQEMLRGGFEISIGMSTDPVFGPVLMVASGGIYMELVQDFELLVPPVSADAAQQALERLACYPILQGARGRGPYDVEALRSAVVALSELVSQAGDELAELDLNPVLVLEQGQGIRVVDALVRLSADGTG